METGVAGLAGLEIYDLGTLTTDVGESSLHPKENPNCQKHKAEGLNTKQMLGQFHQKTKLLEVVTKISKDT